MPREGREKKWYELWNDPFHRSMLLEMPQLVLGTFYGEVKHGSMIRAF